MKFLLILGVIILSLCQLTTERRYSNHSRRYSKYSRPSKSYRKYRSHKPVPSYHKHQHHHPDDHHNYRGNSFDYNNNGGVRGLSLNQIALDALTGVNYVANSGGAVHVVG